MKAKPRPSLLLVHGGPGMDDSYFFPYLEILQKNFDLKSYIQKRNASIQELRNQLAEEIRKLPSPGFLVAHSWGAMLALETLRDQGSFELRGLVLISAAMDNSFNEDFRENLHRWKLIELDQRAESPDQIFRKSTMEAVQLFFSKIPIADALRILGKISYSQSSVDRFFEKYVATFDLRPVLADLKIPVLNLHGEKDYRIPSSHTALLSQLNPLIKSFEVPEVGHFPFCEDPELCCQQIAGFIGQLT